MQPGLVVSPKGGLVLLLVYESELFQVIYGRHLEFLLIISYIFIRFIGFNLYCDDWKE